MEWLWIIIRCVVNGWIAISPFVYIITGDIVYISWTCVPNIVVLMGAHFLPKGLSSVAVAMDDIWLSFILEDTAVRTVEDGVEDDVFLPSVSLLSCGAS